METVYILSIDCLDNFCGNNSQCEWGKHCQEYPDLIQNVSMKQAKFQNLHDAIGIATLFSKFIGENLRICGLLQNDAGSRVPSKTSSIPMNPDGTFTASGDFSKNST